MRQAGRARQSWSAQGWARFARAGWLAGQGWASLAPQVVQYLSGLAGRIPISIIGRDRPSRGSISQSTTVPRL